MKVINYEDHTEYQWFSPWEEHFTYFPVRVGKKWKWFSKVFRREIFIRYNYENYDSFSKTHIEYGSIFDALKPSE